MLKRDLIIIGLFLMCLLPVRSLEAAVMISPAFLELNMDRGRPSGQFLITNTGEQEERYRIQASHFQLNERGALEMVEPDGNSLAPWLKFNPREVTLSPKSKRIVRFVVISQGKLSSKEYWAAMEMESLNTNISKSEDAAGRTMQVEVSSAIIVPIFAANGKVAYRASIGDAYWASETNGNKIHIRVDNTGTGHLLLGGHYQLLDKNGVTLEEGRIARDYVLPGATRIFSVSPENCQATEPLLLRLQFNAPQMIDSVNKEISLLKTSS